MATRLQLRRSALLAQNMDAQAVLLDAQAVLAGVLRLLREQAAALEALERDTAGMPDGSGKRTAASEP